MSGKMPTFEHLVTEVSELRVTNTALRQEVETLKQRNLDLLEEQSMRFKALMDALHPATEDAAPPFQAAASHHPDAVAYLDPEAQRLWDRHDFWKMPAGCRPLRLAKKGVDRDGFISRGAFYLAGSNNPPFPDQLPVIFLD